ncbi:MAG TPA: FtsX-like permease family protein [Candidatus Eisenbacteria bacterium]|nr:FtsX-like permease family protein [Candidatus Eisenbacteria bacterium]
MLGSPMFWRIVRRLLTANYGRLFVILLALGAGGAITSALLNLQIDARRRLTTEFRSLGANVIVAPRGADPNAGGGTLEQSLLSQMPTENAGKPVPAVAFLYVIGDVGKARAAHQEPAVIAGVAGEGITKIRPGKRTEYSAELEKEPDACEVGAKAVEQFELHVGDSLDLRNQGRVATCEVFAVVATGGPEDTQIFVKLATAQALTDLPGRISLIQLSVTGTPESVQSFVAALGQRLPDADVHGIKQFAEAEGKLYNRISGLLSTTVILILILTSLCVMAGMSNVAIERKNDVGLMKAIGGSVRRVVRLFLAEAILLGIMGGMIGSAVGILGSIWLGKTVFGVAAEPRWIVYPVSVGITVIVSIASAFPLRRLASIRPANVFRGEA